MNIFQKIANYFERRLIRQRMLDRATQHLIDQGIQPRDARNLAKQSLNKPPKHPLPKIDELE